MERTINDISETSLNYVSGKEIKFVDYTSPLLALALQDQIRSLRNCSATKVLQKSIDLFSIANSQEVSIISNTSLATALQNTWGATINELLQVFGISSQPISGRERSTIDEVVDKRNAVAHGRDSAAAVGERFRCSDLRMRYDVVYDLMARLVDMFDEYCSNKEFVTTEIRSTYAWAFQQLVRDRRRCPKNRYCQETDYYRNASSKFCCRTLIKWGSRLTSYPVFFPHIRSDKATIFGNLVSKPYNDDG